MAETYRIVADRIGDDLTYLQVEPMHTAHTPELVLCLHGLRSEKVSVLDTCYHFARRGLRAVAPDLPLHGERPHADTLEWRLDEAYLDTMFTIINKSVEDISSLIDHFGCARAGIHGISLGGVVAFASLMEDPRLETASIAMGSPDWVGLMVDRGLPADHPALATLAEISPLTHAARIAPRAVLMMHGDLDETVSITGVRTLHDILRPLYGDKPDRLSLVEYPGMGHTYSDDMIERSVSWAQRYLA